MSDNNKQILPPIIEEDTTTATGMILTLAILGLICSVLIVLTYKSTYATIEENKARYLEKSIFEVLPNTTEKITFTVEDNVMRPLEEGEQAEVKYYAGYDNQQRLTGIAIPTEGQGFQDILGILYGYSPSCHCIVGMKVQESKETPGLGDKIETDPVFRKNFEALLVELTADKNEIVNPIVLVKPRQKTNPWEIDSISGATISSRAIADMLTVSTAEVVPLIEKNLTVLNKRNITND